MQHQDTTQFPFSNLKILALIFSITSCLECGLYNSFIKLSVNLSKLSSSKNPQLPSVSNFALLCNATATALVLVTIFLESDSEDGSDFDNLL